jgi:molybdopterin biosynthesis enzyme
VQLSNTILPEKNHKKLVFKLPGEPVSSKQSMRYMVSNLKTADSLMNKAPDGK